jgi:hypothetical protein
LSEEERERSVWSVDEEWRVRVKCFEERDLRMGDDVSDGECMFE